MRDLVKQLFYFILLYYSMCDKSQRSATTLWEVVQQRRRRIRSGLDLNVVEARWSKSIVGGADKSFLKTTLTQRKGYLEFMRANNSE